MSYLQINAKPKNTLDAIVQTDDTIEDLQQQPMLIDYIGPIIVKDLLVEFVPWYPEYPPSLNDLISNDFEILAEIKEICGTSKIPEKSWMFMAKALQWTVVQYNVDDQWNLNERNFFTFETNVFSRPGDVTTNARKSFDNTLKINIDTLKRRLDNCPEVYTAFHTTSAKVCFKPYTSVTPVLGCIKLVFTFTCLSILRSIFVVPGVWIILQRGY